MLFEFCLDMLKGGCCLRKVLNLFIACLILALAFTSRVRGARKLQQDGLNDEDILKGAENFNPQTESHMKAIEAAIATLTAEESDSLHRMLFTTAATYPPSQKPNAPRPPKASSPPPPLPPGLAMGLQDYSAKFVNADITTELNITVEESVQQFISRFKNITSHFFNISADDIVIRGVYKGGQRLTRRLMLARAERTWTHHQLAAGLPPGSNMRLLIHVRSYAADGTSIQALRQAELALLYPSFASAATTTAPNAAAGIADDPSALTGIGDRALQEADDGGVVIVEFTVVQYVEVSLPPSPPTSPPLSPGQVAPPNTPPSSSSPPRRPSRPPPMHPFLLDRLADELGATKVYITPRPPSPSPLPPSPMPPSPIPPSPAVSSPVSPSPEPPSPLPPSHVPPSPLPLPPLSPSAQGTDTTINVTDILGQGSIVSKLNRGDTVLAGTVVWYDNANFRSFRKPHSALNLIFADKRLPCAVARGVCAPCPRAWAASRDSRVVPIYFREPIQLHTIKILQLQSPGVIIVELLPWPATIIPELPDLAPLSGTLGAPVWNVDHDPSDCGSDLIIRLPMERSGINLSVPPYGTQGNLPRGLRGTAAGGLLITVKDQLPKQKATVIESVRISGRILYPRDSRKFSRVEE
ncbi:hypothetical protein VaNZ11_009206 [Volvox africanus]|uniref:Uncharacterized protein n=1 Tax=Volvox africanus TaxID=51714 RepID=A0ABQ5S7S7_9CHLO|nr:hypothetical protein VaNZ11_009206 [Volvox africanus]